MLLHEYQAKALLSAYNIPCPPGVLITEPRAINDACDTLGGRSWVVKAQVHAGGRGKAGGVAVCHTRDALKEQVIRLLGSCLVTAQTDQAGLPIERVLIEAEQDIAHELYLSLLVDRVNKCITIIACQQGGIDIEQVAAQTPQHIIQAHIDAALGLQAFQCRHVAFMLGLKGDAFKHGCALLQRLFQLMRAKDLVLIEINPLVITPAGQLLALDAKIDIDDNALYRQTELAKYYDASQYTHGENVARQNDLNYIDLAGNIGCMVNGAGLAMATMDLIAHHGGRPANFLDVGGNITVERVTQAFILLSDNQKITAVLINIFGGIVRCDIIARGLLQALKQVKLSMPIVVRFAGNNAQAGIELLTKSAIRIHTSADLNAASKLAVSLAK